MVRQESFPPQLLREEPSRRTPFPNRADLRSILPAPHGSPTPLAPPSQIAMCFRGCYSSKGMVWLQQHQPQPHGPSFVGLMPPSKASPDSQRQGPQSNPTIILRSPVSEVEEPRAKNRVGMACQVMLWPPWHTATPTKSVVLLTFEGSCRECSLP